jgi:hypothetical protein
LSPLLDSWDSRYLLFEYSIDSFLQSFEDEGGPRSFIIEQVPQNYLMHQLPDASADYYTIQNIGNFYFDASIDGVIPFFQDSGYQARET